MGMTENEFLKTLPKSTICEVCSRALHGVHWTVNRYMRGQWVGVGVIKCQACSVVRMAAAGTDDRAHYYAQQLRRRVLTAMGQMH